MERIVIVGAGLGGLSAGALLAQDGYDVTVLEQHSIVGGCATTFKRKGGFICEVGLHEMDGLYTDAAKHEVFERLGVYEHVTFVKPDEFFRIKSQTLDFVMPDNAADAGAALAERFPNARKQIESYFSLIETIHNDFVRLMAMRWHDYIWFPLRFRKVLQYKTRSVRQVLDALFDEEEIKMILNANMGYYHDDASEMSFLFHAVAQYSYYNGQGWFVKGGSQKLSDYLASVITKHGGRVLTQATVVKIEKSRLTYERRNETVSVAFDSVISNLSPMQTYAMAGKEYHTSKQIANSLLTVYLGFSKNLRSLYGKRPYSTFFLNDAVQLRDLDNARVSDAADRGFVFVDYSQIDSALTKDPSKSFAVCCTTDYLVDWEGLDDAAYRAKKTRVLEAYLDEIERHYPGIREHLEYSEVATAKTMQRYLKTPNATAYGFAPTVKQFFKIPQVKSDRMDHLYFVGQWVIAGGFSPAIASGKLAYDAIVKRAGA